MNVFGVDMDANLPRWTNDQRRVGSLLAIGVAALLVLVGLVAFAFLGEDGGALYWSLFGLLLLVLVYELAVVALGMRAESAATPAPAPAGDAHAGPAAPGAWGAPAAAPEPTAPETLTLRCGDCGTVFDVTDTGERPLYHSCPGCGAEGVLREPATPAPEPTAAAPAAAAPASAPAPSAWARPEPAAAAPEPIVPRAVDEAPLTPRPVASALKKLKLRCGGCKQVFAIDDTGDRPLRNRCPHCGRMGEIK